MELKLVNAVVLGVLASALFVGVVSAQGFQYSSDWSFPSSSTPTPTVSPTLSPAPTPPDQVTPTANPPSQVSSTVKPTAQPKPIPELTGLTTLVGLAVFSIVTVTAIILRGKKHEPI